MLSIRSRGIIPEVLLTTRDEVKETDPWVPEQEDAIDGGGGMRGCDAAQCRGTLAGSVACVPEVSLLMLTSVSKCISLKFIFMYLFYGYGVSPVCVCYMHAGPTQGQEMAPDRSYLEL